jgi:glycerol-3-phosphate dehydrogenase
VVWTYSGVRPLVDDGSGKPEAATRGYRLDLSAKPRARRCCQSMAARSPPTATFPRKRWTSLARAPYPFLSADDADRIARAYGTRARAWLGKDQGRDFGGGLRQAEVDYLVAEEWAVSAEDVLWRRTKLGLRLNAEQVAGLRDYLGG